MKTLIILNDPPYGTERTYNGLRLAIALATAGSEVTVFLMADAVAGAKRGQRTPEGFYSIEKMLGRVRAAGGVILLCGTCMDARGLSSEEIVEGAERSDMATLAAATIASDKTLVF